MFGVSVSLVGVLVCLHGVRACARRRTTTVVPSEGGRPSTRGRLIIHRLLSYDKPNISEHLLELTGHLSARGISFFGGNFAQFTVTCCYHYSEQRRKIFENTTSEIRDVATSNQNREERYLKIRGSVDGLLDVKVNAVWYPYWTVFEDVSYRLSHARSGWQCFVKIETRYSWLKRHRASLLTD